MTELFIGRGRRAVGAFICAATILCAQSCSGGDPIGAIAPDAGSIDDALVSVDAGALDGGGAADTGAADLGTSAEGAGGMFEIIGEVVDFDTKRPIADCVVFAGQEQTTTDVDGRFAFRTMPTTYDLIVVDPDGSAISVFAGVSRRDPLVAHRSLFTPDPPALSARVKGNISGGAMFPLTSTDMVRISFFSQRAGDGVSLSGTFHPGPAYGPIFLPWNGPSALEGHLVAIGTFGASTDAGSYQVWFADRTMTLMAGTVATADIALSPSTTGRVFGSVDLAPPRALTQLQQYYRFPLPNAIIGLGNDDEPSPAFDAIVPDLRTAGAKLCIAAISNEDSVLRTERCDVGFDSAEPLTIQAPPALSAPKSGASIDNRTVFSWSPFEHGLHLLELEAATPSRATPSIRVLTAASNAVWPDLSRISVPFPQGAPYQISVAGLGPFSTIDDAIGPAGLGAVIRPETRQSDSLTVDATTAR